MTAAAEVLRRQGLSVRGIIRGPEDTLRRPVGSYVGPVELKDRAKPAGRSANQGLKRCRPCADRTAIREDGRPASERRDTNQPRNRNSPIMAKINRLIGIGFPDSEVFGAGNVSRPGSRRRTASAPVCGAGAALSNRPERQPPRPRTRGAPATRFCRAPDDA